LINLKWHSTIQDSVKCIFGIGVNESKELGRAKQAPSWPGGPGHLAAGWQNAPFIVSGKLSLLNNATFPTSQRSVQTAMAAMRAYRQLREAPNLDGKHGHKY
jgi:hypothetical protein